MKGEWGDWCRSERGFLLPVSNYPGSLPVLTVELYCKWYSLHLVWPTRIVERIDFGRLEPAAASLNCSPFCDHCPNPAAVRTLALAEGWHLDELAEELIVGRWHIEVGDCGEER